MGAAPLHKIVQVIGSPVVTQHLNIVLGGLSTHLPLYCRRDQSGPAGHGASGDGAVEKGHHFVRETNRDLGSHEPDDTPQHPKLGCCGDLTAQFRHTIAPVDEIVQPEAKGSTPSTDEVVQRLADEAESGYDTAVLRRKGGRKPLGSAAARVVPVRLDPELDEALKARAEADHSTTSEVIRAALRAWLRSA